MAMVELNLPPNLPSFRRKPHQKEYSSSSHQNAIPDPTPQLLVLPTIAVVVSFSVGKLLPLFTRPLCRLVAVGKSIFIVCKGLSIMVVDVGDLGNLIFEVTWFGEVSWTWKYVTNLVRSGWRENPRAIS
ncbi:hypothetical protein PIB30_058695 [Stylosanthes scabra]|uniref:Uncharacterized protein n=1 Tax=Stylosanthes scabra TaxID=79078 RepID=A0ABU6XLJ2_9FABA|nr:hypothetical protein [Stylosanthes scabra]